MRRKDTNSSAKGLLEMFSTGMRLMSYLKVQGALVSPPLAFRPLWIAVKHRRLPWCKMDAHKWSDIKQKQSTGYRLFMPVCSRLSPSAAPQKHIHLFCNFCLSHQQQECHSTAYGLATMMVLTFLLWLVITNHCQIVNSTKQHLFFS